jgi:hypothetical protein
MSKSHQLTKLQLLLGILWAIPSFVFLILGESKQYIWFFIGIVPFIGLSVITVYLGWLMVFKKVDIVYPFQNFRIWIEEKTSGKQMAKNLAAEYSAPNRKMFIGGMNMLSGMLCFIIAIVGIVVVLTNL